MVDAVIAQKYRCVVMLGVIVGLPLGATGSAQTPGAAANLQQLLGGGEAPRPEHPLTIRPRTMATATRTERNGAFQLAGMTMYVPTQCVGVRRCPLVLHSNDDEALLVQMADKYGLITAAIDKVLNADALDRALTAGLHTLAVDPDKIAIIGGGGPTGQFTVDLSTQNPGVFSRVLLFTQYAGDLPARALGQTTEYYISGALPANVAGLRAVRHVQDLGYPVKYTLQFRPSGPTAEDTDFMGYWLQESWAIPDPAKRPAPASFEPTPLLTVRAMDQLAKFWQWFMQQPDSIRTVARRAHEREVALAVGDVQVSTLMTDMSVLAARFPSVAAEFHALRLTPQQHDAYRAALAGAHIVGVNKRPQELVPIPETSAVARNVAFLHAHPEAYLPLANTGMWLTP